MYVKFTKFKTSVRIYNIIIVIDKIIEIKSFKYISICIKVYCINIYINFYINFFYIYIYILITINSRRFFMYIFYSFLLH